MLAFWKAHGTKILGTTTLVLATALTFTPDQMAALFGTFAPRAALIMTGLMTILRGIQNSNNLNGGGK